jgi:two-component system sensor histidine kinase VicK
MESGGKSVTKRHRKKWVDALSLVLPVLLFFAVLNCFTTYLYYQDYQCKMDILTEVAAGAETTGMDVAAGWLKGNDHQANEQGKQLLECNPRFYSSPKESLSVTLSEGTV